MKELAKHQQAGKENKVCFFSPAAGSMQQSGEQDQQDFL